MKISSIFILKQSLTLQLNLNVAITLTSWSLITHLIKLLAVRKIKMIIRWRFNWATLLALLNKNPFWKGITIFSLRSLVHLIMINILINHWLEVWNFSLIIFRIKNNRKYLSPMPKHFRMIMLILLKMSSIQKFIYLSISPQKSLDSTIMYFSLAVLIKNTKPNNSHSLKIKIYTQKNINLIQKVSYNLKYHIIK